jgi:transcriptional regulator with XRE-family HTH domain
MPPRRRSQPDSPEQAALGEAVRRLRQQAGLSQEELAERVDTDLSQVGGIERGTRNPTFVTLVRFAAALDTTVGAIATLADEIRS